MRTSRVMVCCVLVFIALEMMTSIDGQKAMEKKNRKQQKKDLTNDKSTKEESKKEAMADVNPKLKPFQNKQTRRPPGKKIQTDSTEIPTLLPDVADVKDDQAKIKPQDDRPEKKTQNDSTEIPILLPDFADVQVEQFKPLDVKQVLETTLPVPPPPQNCSPAVGNSDKLLELERNVTSLWRHLSIVSQPIHVHVHGGRDSSPGYHGNHGSRGRCHGDRSGGGHHRSHKDSVAETQDYHGHSQNHSQDHSHHHHNNHSVRPNPITHDSDKPRPHNTSSKCGCHGRHNRTHNETGHGDHNPKSHHHSEHHSKNHTHVQRPGDRSHKSHHQSKHHSKSHSHAHHAHRLQDHSHKSHHHSKHHSHGYKSAKGHDYHHRGGHGFGDRSTHIHIHLTLDEKPSPVHREINQSEPTAAKPTPEVSHEHTDPPTPEPVFGRCDFLNNGINNNLVGYVLLRQSSSGLDVAVNISGFDVPANGSDQQDGRLHGFHVHESGDFSKGCLSFGGHFNPEGTTHGGLTHDIRHVGDWGNIEANAQGLAVTQFSVQDATLQGPHSILGRGIVVHEHVDDLGEGGVPASKTTGNAGGRLACCIIGHSKPLPEEAFQRRNDTLSNTASDAGQISGS